ncbi:MAG TPA: enoyl-CoA hydratase-related protein [Candidatus Dormibacteraeota bacterium]|nr:enoyl-CoA hydratase-related protein [Candidatus Dormibacteraeota bacterium]
MGEVLLEVQEGVAILTLNAPERRNALVPSMVRELLELCDQIDNDASIGAVVVRAAGESFCAGAHRALLAEAGQDPARPDRYRDLELTYRAFARVGELRPPTIAAVRGHAVGAGVNLMLATDLRLIAERARVIAGFLRIGIHPGGGHFTLLGRLAGREAAAAMALFGEEIDGRTAVRLGLAWEALPEPEVEPRALEMARRVAADPELARAAVRSLRLELGPPAIPWTAALEVEKAVQMWSLRRRAERHG